MISIEQFSEHLFWDTNRDKLDIDKNCAYIIKQVLEYGLIDDWKLIKAYFGVQRIGEIASSFRELDEKSLSFISLLSRIPVENFRCYTYKQSVPQHWNF